ncbi:hypothetical protein F4780DRAFT_777230 [Xylariomycetidae sp. FL0641]|nr:hypothetical protein F4780DRAFT_777230 [Xylariomycetidae sp. FL0641]
MRFTGAVFMAFMGAATAMNTSKPLRTPVDSHMEMYEPLTARDTESVINKRTWKPVCDKPRLVGGVARVESFQEGLKYLRKLEGPCTADTGGCTRVSCSHDAAIYLCNHPDGNQQVPCSTIANLVDHITNECRQPNDFKKHRNHYAMGYVEYPDGYTVAVGWNKC